MEIYYNNVNKDQQIVFNYLLLLFVNDISFICDFVDLTGFLIEVCRSYAIFLIVCLNIILYTYKTYLRNFEKLHATDGKLT
jgi:hypothetical protein